MSLTPCKDDPNRRAELARKKKDPLAFGAFNDNPIEERPKDWKPSGLAVNKPTKKTEESK
jgi:hypothetical protein